MKKLFTLILCLTMLFLVPLSVSAEENAPETEMPTEGEILPPADTTTEEEPDWDEVKDTVSGTIKAWIIPHIEEISVILTLIASCFYNVRKHKLLNNSIGILNNNAITVAKESSNFMSQALTNIENTSGAVTNYDARIVALLDAYKTTAEDKLRLEKELVEIKNYLKINADANVEFANELAELLGLSNIPNYKKEEIGARHLTAVNAIIEAEAKAEVAMAENEEVNTDAGEEKKN